MSLEQRRLDGDKAKELLDNPLLQAALGRVGYYIEQQAAACDPDNKDMAQRVIISKQIYLAIRREFERAVEDGEIARIQIAQIEKRKRGLFKR